MSHLVNIHFHYVGKWVFHLDIMYVEGEVDTINNFDPDYLSYISIKKRYIKQFGYAYVSSIFVLEPGKTLNNGLLLIDDDDGIRRVLGYIREYSWVDDIEIYANYDVDVHISPTNYLAIEGPPIENQELVVKPLAWYTGWQGRPPRMVMFKPQASPLLIQSACKNFYQARKYRTMKQPSMNDGFRRKNTALVFDWYQEPLEEEDDEDSLYNFSL